MNKDSAALEAHIGYSFCDKSLLMLALTHTSYANERKDQKNGHNERLEFLGDAVLSIVVADALYKRFPDILEGDLTRIRASLVCEKTLFLLAEELGLGEYLYLGKGEDQSGGRNRPSVLSDAFEAVIAAIYLDGGMEEARSFILPRIDSHIDRHYSDIPRDYKSELQEIVQQNHGERITYAVVKQQGPDHCRVYTVEAHLNSNVIGSGTAATKKEAEQRAAREALRLMGR